MEICGAENGFDYYSAQVTIGEDIFRYYFEIQYGWVTCYYNNQGVCMKHEGRMDFEIYPGFDTPKWAKGAVMYQIYVDRFLNGDPTNDVVTGEYHYIGDKSVQVEQWNKIPAVMGVREFYGGDLQGIMDKQYKIGMVDYEQTGLSAGSGSRGYLFKSDFCFSK